MTDIGLVLRKIGRGLVTEVAPMLQGGYAAGNANMSGLLAILAGEAFDGAADRLKREIDAMGELLAAAGEPAPDPPASLKISDLDAARNAHAAALIALQARLEASDAPDDRALNTRIWAFLLAGAVERMPSPPDFGGG